MEEITFNDLPALVADLRGDIAAALAALTRLEARDNDKPAPEPFIGVTEAAKILFITPATVYKNVADNTIPHYKRGARLYFKESDLRAHIEGGKRRTNRDLRVVAERFVTPFETKNRKA